MKTLNNFLNEATSTSGLGKVIATNNNIKQLITESIAEYGNEADLNYIDVSNVTNMK